MGRSSHDDAAGDGRRESFGLNIPVSFLLGMGPAHARESELLYIVFTNS